MDQNLKWKYWNGNTHRGFWGSVQHALKHEKHCYPIIVCCGAVLSLMTYTILKNALYAPDLKFNHHSDTDRFEYLRGKCYKNFKTRDDFSCYAPKYWESDELSPRQPPAAPIDDE